MRSNEASATLNGQRLLCQGNWNVHWLPSLIAILKKLTWPTSGTLIIDGTAISHLDSAAAWLLLDWQEKLHKRGITVHYEQFSTEAEQILNLVRHSDITKKHVPLAKKIPSITHFLNTVNTFLGETVAYLSFIGGLAGQLTKVIRHPSQLRLYTLANQIYQAGFRALPIIGLLSCMVGVVLAYQLGIQLRNYGANVFIADLLGLSVLREFGPLLTAIMVAGRTGSSFTAEIGMMKITQEIDALQTMGIVPEVLLIIPRLIALVIVLPLLTIWADIFGILGGMMMAGNMLEITWYDFLVRLQHQVPLRMLVIGLCKAPVFALIIASIGCFEGMKVNYTADSLGKNTTRSVVLAIFMIILTDAAFSILFSRLRL